MKSYTSIKLTRSSLYFIEKNNWGEYLGIYLRDLPKGKIFEKSDW